MVFLDARRHTSDEAARLWDDIEMPTVIRCIFEFYSRDSFSTASMSGRQYLTGCIQTPADNKTVEDVHAPIRNDSDANMNKRRSKIGIQHLIQHCGVLERRKIPHTCVVTKDMFLSEFRQRRNTLNRRIASFHKCSNHKLPADWSGIMKKKKTLQILDQNSPRAHLVKMLKHQHTCDYPSRYLFQKIFFSFL